MNSLFGAPPKLYTLVELYHFLNPFSSRISLSVSYIFRDILTRDWNVLSLKQKSNLKSGEPLGAERKILGKRAEESRGRKESAARGVYPRWSALIKKHVAKGRETAANCSSMSNNRERCFSESWRDKFVAGASHRVCLTYSEKKATSLSRSGRDRPTRHFKRIVITDLGNGRERRGEAERRLNDPKINAGITVPSGTFCCNAPAEWRGREWRGHGGVAASAKRATAKLGSQARSEGDFRLSYVTIWRDTRRNLPRPNSSARIVSSSFTNCVVYVTLRSARERRNDTWKASLFALSIEYAQMRGRVSNYDAIFACQPSLLLVTFTLPAKYF